MTTTQAHRDTAARYLHAATMFLVAMASVCILAAGSMEDETWGPYAPETPAGTDGRPVAPGSPEGLIQANGCWEGAAPADMEGKMPGHVIVRREAGDAFVGGPRMVGKALDQVFNHTDHGLTVFAFCR